jgi:hypothetical protein
MSVRARLTSFLTGFGLAGGATFYQLHKDITAGTTYLAEQVCLCARVIVAVCGAVCAAQRDSSLPLQSRWHW